MQSYFKDKVIWITGATSGVGKAIAEQFISWNVSVILSGSSLSKLEQAFPYRNDDTQKFLPFNLSAFNPEEIVQDAFRFFNRIDILYNNAGISQHSKIKYTPDHLSRKFMEVNYFGNIFLTKALLPIFENQGSGQVIVTSSIIGLFGQPLLGSYAASKHAINGWYESLQYELKDVNINATLIILGFVNTDISKKSLRYNGELYNKNSPAQEKGLSTKKCALEIIKATTNNKRRKYIGGLELMMHRVRFFSPNLFFKLLSFLNKGKMSSCV